MGREDEIGMNISDRILQLIEQANQPWWVYALILLIPLCLMISVREFACWFWKLNKIVDRLERIETKLGALAVEGNQSREAAKKKTSPPPEPKAVPPPTKTGPTSL